MSYVLEDLPPTDYKMYYVHQCDNRDFNRGALKNIGFLAVKALYPNHYRDITLVFNDVDTMPYSKNFLNYETTHGSIKHFYGFRFTLGGIVSIKAGDFEKIGGFPNLWAWGFEDNELQHRVMHANLTIDRSQFYTMMDKNILQLKDGLNRVVNRKEFDRYISKTYSGFNTITDLHYEIDANTGFLNVKHFTTETQNRPDTNTTYDIRQGPVVFPKRRPMGMLFR